MEVFKDRLRELRGNHSQEEIAKAIGITPQSLGRYEKGERKPDIEVLKLIAKHFDVSADFLLGLSDNKTTDSDINNACNVTGLREEAIKHLQYLTSDNDLGNNCNILEAFILSIGSIDLHDIKNLLLLTEKQEIFEIEFIKKFCKRENLDVSDEKINEYGLHIFKKISGNDVKKRNRLEEKYRMEKLKAINNYSLIDRDLTKDLEFEEFKVSKRILRLITNELRFEYHKDTKDDAHKKIKDYYAKALESDPQSEDLGFLAIENYDMLRSV